MKKILFIFICLILFSCTEDKEIVENNYFIYEDYKIELINVSGTDTLFVDIDSTILENKILLSYYILPTNINKIKIDSEIESFFIGIESVNEKTNKILYSNSTLALEENESKEINMGLLQLNNKNELELKFKEDMLVFKNNIGLIKIVFNYDTNKEIVFTK